MVRNFGKEVTIVMTVTENDVYVSKNCMGF